MLGTIYRQHTERVLVLKQKQGNLYLKKKRLIISSIEKKKRELLTSADQLTRVILDGLNNE